MSDRRTSPHPGPAAIAEDPHLRSQFMRQLLTASGGPTSPANGNTAPRVLVQFWNDASTVPGDVQECLDSWAPLENAGFERLLFDDTSAGRFIQEHFAEQHMRAFARCHHPAMRADYFRLCFMLRVGGLYVDADDECQGASVEPLVIDGVLRLQPLVYDIPSDSMVAVERALDTSDTGERIFYVNNNPIITAPEHPVIAKSLERATALLLAADESDRDIQALTGPGNLTASLVAYAAELQAQGKTPTFELMTCWDTVAVSKWPLSYRADERNWRHWVRGEGKAARS
ncbi:glycosyltransferase family 32 protein [Sphaerisporangium siamense]|uniref:glycosyltransferase family 32 protein n=1 Tax=Sphaerisporangium siamense TaxID=795645 RepID=UPI00194FC7F8|nr:glycosyltransferase [Sphaerisporangium siamense]